ncbi:668_t:CDS:1, partial [Racocetra persica]
LAIGFPIYMPGICDTILETHVLIFRCAGAFSDCCFQEDFWD